MTKGLTEREVEGHLRRRRLTFKRNRSLIETALTQAGATKQATGYLDAEVEGGWGGMMEQMTTPVLRLGADSGGIRIVVCSRYRLVISYGDGDVMVMADLLASHWADDHHAIEWRDTAADARDRLWRKRPDLLEQLEGLVGVGRD